MSNQRSCFEAWVIGSDLETAPMIFQTVQTDKKEYANRSIQKVWEVWQAAWARCTGFKLEADLYVLDVERRGRLLSMQGAGNWQDMAHAIFEHAGHDSDPYVSALEHDLLCASNAYDGQACALRDTERALAITRIELAISENDFDPLVEELEIDPARFERYLSAIYRTRGMQEGCTFRDKAEQVQSYSEQYFAKLRHAEKKRFDEQPHHRSGELTSPEAKQFLNSLDPAPYPIPDDYEREPVAPSKSQAKRSAAARKAHA